MDSNVIGRMPREVGLDPDAPRYVRILVRDLTAKTAGNAVGMGLADFATRRLADKVNFHATYTNVLTASVSLGAKLPIIFEQDPFPSFTASADAARITGMPTMPGRSTGGDGQCRPRCPDSALFGLGLNGPGPLIHHHEQDVRTTTRTITHARLHPAPHS